MRMFSIEDNGGPAVTIRNVPIFRAHTDRNYNCDETWLDRCVADFWSQRVESMELGGDEKYAILPSITVGHTPTNPDAPEPPAIGHLDNVRRVGKYLLADFVGLDRNVFNQIKTGKFPYRSAEVIPNKHRLTNVSLLGGRYPHFPLPIMRFQTNGGTVLRYTIAHSERTNMSGKSRYMNESMPNGAVGDGGSVGEHEEPTSEEMGGADDNAMLGELAEQLIPIIMQKIAEKQGNQPEMAASGAAYTGSRRVARYDESNDAGQHTSKTADAAKDDEFSTKRDEASVSFGDESAGSHQETFKGPKMGSDKMKMSSVTVEQYAQLMERMALLEEQNDELRRHNAAQTEAAKRSILRSNVRQMAAVGYAIGDFDAIERHVERMMMMNPQDIKSYMEDVLKKFPKVNTSVERHGTHNGVRHPDSGSENERYYHDNQTRLDGMGLNREVLDLADVLSG